MHLVLPHCIDYGIAHSRWLDKSVWLVLHKEHVFIGLHALHLHTTQFLDVARIVGLFTCVGAFVQPFAHVASDGLYVTTMHAQFLDVKLVAEQVLRFDFLPRSGHGLDVFAVLLGI